MKKRIGLLGAAKIAPKAIIAPVSKRDDCEVVAVGCRNPEKRAVYIAEHVPGARVTDYAGICSADDIDIVYCALPPSEHLEWVMAAINSGKAVLCEKPFSMNGTEAEMMMAAATSANVYVMEAFHYYFHPAFQSVLTRYRSGEFGKAVGFKGVFTAAIANKRGELRYIPELGGGSLMDLGCYPLHAARQILGEPDIASVKADIESGVDAALTSELRFSDCRGEIISDMRAGGPREMSFELLCERGALRFDNFVHPYTGYEIKTVIDSIEHVETGTGPVTYDAQLEAFIGRLDGNPTGLPVSDATLQMQAIEDIYAKVGLR